MYDWMSNAASLSTGRVAASYIASGSLSFVIVASGAGVVLGRIVAAAIAAAAGGGFGALRFLARTARALLIVVATLGQVVTLIALDVLIATWGTLLAAGRIGLTPLGLGPRTRERDDSSPR
ncbi:hypothetical protein [Nocardiopsis quinghaiensis]|uniref:hypothetical protein n=1 Tax=Nocardiopsis quinghaiensis TaxID=464995 RepID=UPI00123B4268|nr:hypothetical protein [Nocardiopsis quinghaiensis]